MMSCRQARSILVASVGRQATEAESLLLEQHLATCASCRSEKARWRLLEQVRDQAPQRLSTDARGRVLDNLMTMLPGDQAGLARFATFNRRARRFWAPILLTTASAVSLVAIVAALKREDRALVVSSPPVPVHASSNENRRENLVDHQADPFVIHARAAGAMETPGARIAYRAGSAFRLAAQGREVDLYSGEIDVEVAPGGPGRFRVVASRFTVEVLGTHFIVQPERVVTLRGTVRVVDSAGQEVAVLHGGQSWNVSALDQRPPVLPQERLSVDSLAPPPRASPVALAAPGNQPITESSVVPAMRPNLQPSPGPAPAAATHHTPDRNQARLGHARVDMLLAEARSVLAAGEAKLARERIVAALDNHPSARQRAMAELLAADSFLVESRYSAALAAYRRTSAMFDGFPESETAAFATAQLLCERGSQADARSALQRYVERYPNGRFIEDARRKLRPLP
jgi:ferric-dicitrate binding protein FerR (iron transport regulator)